MATMCNDDDDHQARFDKMMEDPEKAARAHAVYEIICEGAAALGVSYEEYAHMLFEGMGGGVKAGSA